MLMSVFSRDLGKAVAVLSFIIPKCFKCFQQIGDVISNILNDAISHKEDPSSSLGNFSVADIESKLAGKHLYRVESVEEKLNASWTSNRNKCCSYAYIVLYKLKKTNEGSGLFLFSVVTTSGW